MTNSSKAYIIIVSLLLIAILIAAFVFVNHNSSQSLSQSPSPAAESPVNLSQSAQTSVEAVTKKPQIAFLAQLKTITKQSSQLLLTVQPLYNAGFYLIPNPLISQYDPDLHTIFAEQKISLAMNENSPLYIVTVNDELKPQSAKNLQSGQWLKVILASDAITSAKANLPIGSLFILPSDFQTKAPNQVSQALIWSRIPPQIVSILPDGLSISEATVHRGESILFLNKRPVALNVLLAGQKVDVMQPGGVMLERFPAAGAISDYGFQAQGPNENPIAHINITIIP